MTNLLFENFVFSSFANLGKQEAKKSYCLRLVGALFFEFWQKNDCIIDVTQFFSTMPQNTTPSSSFARIALANHDPNIIRCRKCHKWYDRTKARTAKASKGIYDEEIDWTFSESFTRVYCPYCGYWHR